MKKHWLVNQLPKNKQHSPMWQGLADALETIFNDHIQPLVTRAASMNSMFAMSDEDLQKKLDEMGSFFYTAGNIEREDLPLAISQRLDEVHFKRTDLPISNTISREFNGMHVEWAPYWAPIVITPQGSRDYTKKEINGSLVNALKTQYEIEFVGENLNDYFMTSRGVIQISLSRMSEDQINQKEFSSAIRRLIRPIIPVDIVFDGERIFVEYGATESEEKALLISAKLNCIFSIWDKEKAKFKDDGKDKSTLSNPIDNDASYVVRIDETPIDAWFFDSV